jgi:hypothetical protein
MYDWNREVRPELGCMNRVVTSTGVGMYDWSHDVRPLSGCMTSVRKCDRSWEV